MGYAKKESDLKSLQRTYISKNNEFQELLNDLLTKNARLHEVKNQKIRRARERQKKKFTKKFKRRNTQNQMRNVKNSIGLYKQRKPKSKEQGFFELVTKSLLEKGSRDWDKEEEEREEISRDSERKENSLFTNKLDLKVSERFTSSMILKPNPRKNEGQEKGELGRLEGTPKMQEMNFTDNADLKKNLYSYPEFNEKDFFTSPRINS